MVNNSENSDIEIDEGGEDILSTIYLASMGSQGNNNYKKNSMGSQGKDNYKKYNSYPLVDQVANQL